MRSSNALPGATKTLRYLQSQKIPFILLTNGGGKTEEERVKDLSETLDVPLDTSNFMQSHTPFQELVVGQPGGREGLRNKHVLVVGGEGDRCRQVAERYLSPSTRYPHGSSLKQGPNHSHDRQQLLTGNLTSYVAMDSSPPSPQPISFYLILQSGPSRNHSYPTTKPLPDRSPYPSSPTLPSITPNPSFPPCLQPVTSKSPPSWYSTILETGVSTRP